MRAALVALLAVAALPVDAAEWELDLDVRAIASEGERSFVDGGLGALRFGEGKSGIRLGRARLALTQPLGEVLALRVDASAWDTDDKNPADLSEAYVEYRPYPRAGFRARVKAGAFYSPISLENRAGGWDSPYTISSSALNTWIAEELRTIGLEAQIDWLGTRLGHDFDLGIVAAVYGWNDPLGGIVASKGFGLHDRQTMLFGRVGQRAIAPLYGREMFHEIDDRAGIYYGVEARYLDRVTARALRYDNRADPAVFDPALGDFAWKTLFDSAGLRWESAGGWTAIVQWLDGETYVAPGGPWLEWRFDARFALLSKRAGKHMVSVRRDEFGVTSNRPGGEGWQDGHAWTAAYVYEHSARWRFTLEALRVKTELQNRAIYLGEAPLATESKLELAARYSLGTLAR